MTEKVSTIDVRQRIGDLLNRVALRHDEFVIERKGKPLAALVPIERLEQMRRFARRHALELLEKQKQSTVSEEQALEIALENPRLARRLVLVNALGLGRPKPQMAQMAYGLVTVPHVGEAVMRFTRSALRWAPPRTIRRVAGRFAGSSSDLEKVMDDDYLHNLREMYETPDFHNAYLSTVRSLIHPRALLGGQHDVSQRLSELKMPVQLIWGADDPLFPVAHATRAHALIPDCKLAVIEGAGHTPQAERPDEFNRLLNDFLSA